MTAVAMNHSSLWVAGGQLNDPACRNEKNQQGSGASKLSDLHRSYTHQARKAILVRPCLKSCLRYKGNCVLFQSAAKGLRAESNLPGLTPLIPVSHPPQAALNPAWQRELPRVCQTPTEKQGKTNTCYQDAVIGERKCLKGTQMQRKIQRRV